MYNCAEFIGETYESLLLQTFTNWEWLIVDDCSTDSSLHMIKRIARRDARVKVFENRKNLGAAVSRNLAIDNAQGVLVSFLDADDLWYPDKLSTQVEEISAGQGMVFSAYDIFEETPQKIIKTVDNEYIQSVGYHDLLQKKVVFGCSTVMIRREIVGDLRMPLLNAGQDYAFWLSIMRNGVKAGHLPRPLAAYRKRDGSLSSNKWRKAWNQWRIYRDHEQLNLLYSLYLFSSYAFRGFRLHYF
jgi:teichuronic acid biosynthesis glycosyltransferase TuaG